MLLSWGSEKRASCPHLCSHSCWLAGWGRSISIQRSFTGFSCCTLASQLCPVPPTLAPLAACTSPKSPRSCVPETSHPTRQSKARGEGQDCDSEQARATLIFTSTAPRAWLVYSAFPLVFGNEQEDPFWYCAISNHGMSSRLAHNSGSLVGKERRGSAFDGLSRTDSIVAGSARQPHPQTDCEFSHAPYCLRALRYSGPAAPPTGCVSLWFITPVNIHLS